MKKLKACKAILFIFFLFPCLNISGQGVKVRVSEVLDSSNINDGINDSIAFRVIQSLDMVKEFLRKQKTVQFGKDSTYAKEILVLTQFPLPDHLLYEIVAIDQLQNSKIIFVVNSYLFFPKENFKNFQGFFKIGYDNQRKKIIFPVYDTTFRKIASSNINFIARPGHYDIHSFEKTNKYIVETIAHIRDAYNNFSSPDAKLTYVVSTGDFKALEYYGLYYYIFTSRYFNTINTIIDTQTSGFYKHELVHYITSRYTFSKFLNEGIAIYFSGGESRHGFAPQKAWTNIKSKLKINQPYCNACNDIDSLQNLFLHCQYTQKRRLDYCCSDN